MMVKRKPLNEALAEAATGQPAKPATEPKPQHELAPTARYQAPSRQGKKQLTVWLSPEAKKQLKSMAVERDTSVEALMIEALNQFFARAGKSQIA